MKRVVEETIVVENSREHWFDRCKQAMWGLAKPEDVKADETFWQIEGKWFKWGFPSYDGHLSVTLIPCGTDKTEIRMRATASSGLENMIFKPHQKIIPKYKEYLKSV